MYPRRNSASRVCGHHRGSDSFGFPLAERIRGAGDRDVKEIRPGSLDHPWRAALASDGQVLLGLLEYGPDAPLVGQRLT